ncbi:MAG: Wzz/FepE/Etk N-terminal domain-containing protein, partial [Bacteroidia bacterium]
MLQEDISKTNDSFERYKERISNFSGEFELGLFLFIAKKSLVWILIFFGVAFVAAKLYLRYTPPVFEASSTIQVQTSNQANKLLNVDNLAEGTGNGLAEAVELLRSKVFLKRVLSKLPLQIGYYAEGTFKNNELYKSSPFTVEVKRTDDKIVGKKIYVAFNSSTQGVVNFTMDNQNYTKNYTVNQWINFPQFDLKVNITKYSDIEKQQNAVKENAFYFTVNDTASIADSYFSNVDVKL